MKYLVFSGKPIQFLTVLAGIHEPSAEITLLYEPSHKNEKFGWNKITAEWVEILESLIPIELVPFGNAKKELADRTFDYILFDWAYIGDFRNFFIANAKGAKIVKVIHGCSDYYEYVGEQKSLYSHIDEVWTLIDYPAKPGRFYDSKDSLRVVQVDPAVFIELLDKLKRKFHLPILEISDAESSILFIHQNLSPAFMDTQSELAVYRDAIQTAVDLGYHVYWKSHYVVGHNIFEILQKDFPKKLTLLNVPQGVPLEFFYQDIQKFAGVTGLYSTALWTFRDIFDVNVTTIMGSEFMKHVMPSREWWVNNLPVAFQMYVSFPQLSGVAVEESDIADLVFSLIKGKQLSVKSEFRCKVAHFRRLPIQEKLWITRRLIFNKSRNLFRRVKSFALRITKSEK